MNKFTTNDARIVESKANDPTQADMKLVEDIDEILLEDATDEGYELASKRVAQHVQEAVKAETQRMCDVAYAVYNHGDPEVPTLWMDGAAAVFEALGKEVK